MSEIDLAVASVLIQESEAIMPNSKVDRWRAMVAEGKPTTTEKQSGPVGPKKTDEAVNLHGLPPMLSPTLPPEIEEELARSHDSYDQDGEPHSDDWQLDDSSEEKREKDDTK